MRTFKVSIAIDAKVTLPDTVLRDIRILASEEDAPPYLTALSKEHSNDDDAFLQAALKNALRSVVRNGLVTDLGGLGEGVGVRAAPPTITVSVPERVVTKVKGREQVPQEHLRVEQNPQYMAVGQEGSLEQADY